MDGISPASSHASKPSPDGPPPTGTSDGQRPAKKPRKRATATDKKHVCPEPGCEKCRSPALSTVERGAGETKLDGHWSFCSPMSSTGAQGSSAGSLKTFGVIPASRQQAPRRCWMDEFPARLETWPQLLVCHSQARWHEFSQQDGEHGGALKKPDPLRAPPLLRGTASRWIWGRGAELRRSSRPSW